MECVGQFLGEPAARRRSDEGLNGGDERTVAGEPDRAAVPQARIVESDDFPESVVAAAVSIWTGNREA
jgi:hypothetical protein